MLLQYFTASIGNTRRGYLESWSDADRRLYRRRASDDNVNGEVRLGRYLTWTVIDVFRLQNVSLWSTLHFSPPATGTATDKLRA